ncbi:hypothetical protein [Microbacterium arabinogalactanolyticum]|uniref:Lipoprotein n=1 Tax=Microbacterium arabinogalactanolyticum TaxID=69365 RepID=A0ABQ5NDE4_9MICO|nr:hypothetical protein [Microbacterium arabinogalactanolyticum]GLC83562.1 hypothetical protein MIAR_01500 [Microbacterium arabinogalactanolyticum]
MPKYTVALAVAAVALLTGCSAAQPAPTTSPKPPKPTASVGTVSVKESCERFNELDHRLAQTDPKDNDALVDLYSEFDAAGQDATDDQVKGLLISMSIVVLQYTDPAGPSQEDKDQASRFFLSASGPCTAEGVTLNMEVL